MFMGMHMSRADDIGAYGGSQHSIHVPAQVKYQNSALIASHFLSALVLLISEIAGISHFLKQHPVVKLSTILLYKYIWQFIT